MTATTVGTARAHSMEAEPRPFTVKAEIAPPRGARAIRYGVLTFVLFLLALLWSGIAIHLGYDRRQTLEQGWARSASLSASFAEHLTGVMRAMDQTLVSLKQDYEGGPDSFDLRDALVRYPALRDVSSQVSLIGADGMLMSASRGMPDRPLYLGDRDYFQAHVAHDTGKMFIGTPLVSRIEHVPLIGLSRRLSNPDGSFAGVMVVVLDPAYLASVFATPEIRQHGFVSLVGRDDMIVRVRSTTDGGASRTSMASTELARKIAAAPTGTYEARSAIDGVDRVLSYHVLPDYPLVLVLGLARDEILARSRERANWLILAGVAISFIFVGAGALLIRQTNRQARIEHDLRRQAAQLMESRREADLASRAKTQFLANMSHELRTPLNAILGFSDLMANSAFGPIGSAKYLEYARDIHRSGQHLLELINSVLDMSKIEAGKLQLVPEDIDLVPVVEECLGVISLRAAEGRITLENRLGARRFRVRADRRSLRQMLLNLLANAVKFTFEDGRIGITAARAADGMVAIAVTDTGIGIAEEDLPRVFEPFQQAAGALSRTREGTGLGLAITKSLVELNGGRLTIESRVKVGTTVTLYLPAADSAEDSAPRRTSSGLPVTV